MRSEGSQAPELVVEPHRPVRAGLGQPAQPGSDPIEIGGHAFCRLGSLECPQLRGDGLAKLVEPAAKLPDGAADRRSECARGNVFGQRLDESRITTLPLEAWLAEFSGDRLQCQAAEGRARDRDRRPAAGARRSRGSVATPDTCRSWSARAGPVVPPPWRDPGIRARPVSAPRRHR